MHAVSLEQLVRNQVLMREVNERVAEVACGWTGDPPKFVCECSHDDCAEMLALSLPEYERIRSSPNLFVIAPGHQSPEVDRVVEARQSSSLVEKTKYIELVFSGGVETPPETGALHEHRQ
jgi:hypothetical protein